MNSTNKTKARKENKILHMIKAPIRILIRARDFYMKGMSECGGSVQYGGIVGCPAPQVSALPKSFSVSSSKSGHDEDLRELVKVASTRTLGNKIELELLRRQQIGQSPTSGTNGVVPRSQSTSVAFARIDEDKSCEFEEDNVNLKATGFYPRSRSHAVTTPKRTGFI